MNSINHAENSTGTPSSSGRIASIDGLRAIAIFAVLIFHIDEAYLPGGYLGVDLFFVISGFVVTRSLVSGTKRSYGRFLAARFYRLAPAAAVTVLLTLILFEFTGSGLLDRTHVASGIASVVALSNMYFMLQDSYFDGALQGNPLLHFWSLSVEEQFYFVWPAVAAALVGWSIFKKTLFVGVLALFSFAAFHFYPDQAFFFMPARAFQFAAGASAFLLYRRYPLRVPALLLYLGLLAAIVPFILLDGSQPWVLNTLAPTVLFTATMYAAAGASHAWLLVLRPVQMIGAASYSVYLVHWPIIVYLYILHPSSIQIQALALAASFAAGFMLHYLIERPFNALPAPAKRSIKREKRPKANHRSFAAPAFTVLTLAFAGYLTSTAFSQFSEENQTTYLASLGPAPAPATAIMAQVAAPSTIPQVAAPVVSLEDNLLPATTFSFNSADTPRGVFLAGASARAAAIKKGGECNTFEPGRNQGKPGAKLLADLDLAYCLTGEALLLGDSTWTAAAPILATTLGGSELAQLNSSGCIFVLGAATPDCALINDLRVKILRGESAYQFETIYLAFNWRGHGEERLAALIEEVAQSGAKVVFLTPLPTFQSSPDQIVAANSSAQADLFPWLEDGIQEARSILASAAVEHQNIDLLEWSSLDATDPKLPASTASGHRVYSDHYHYTDAGIEWLAMQYLERS